MSRLGTGSPGLPLVSWKLTHSEPFGAVPSSIRKLVFSNGNFDQPWFSIRPPMSMDATSMKLHTLALYGVRFSDSTLSQLETIKFPSLRILYLGRVTPEGLSSLDDQAVYRLCAKLWSNQLTTLDLRAIHDPADSCACFSSMTSRYYPNLKHLHLRCGAECVPSLEQLQAPNLRRLLIKPESTMTDVIDGAGARLSTTVNGGLSRQLSSAICSNWPIFEHLAELVIISDTTLCADAEHQLVCRGTKISRGKYKLHYYVTPSQLLALFERDKFTEHRAWAVDDQEEPSEPVG